MVSSNRGFWLCVAVLACVLNATGYSAPAEEACTAAAGDSLVLAGMGPGMLCFDKVVPDSVTVRSTYEPGQDATVVYEAGRDYTVDYARGTIARTAESRIPDFSTNMLYGQKEFDHSKFPGFGNKDFFVYADYRTEAHHPLADPTDQSALLPKTTKKLRGGGPFKIVAYGDSITAGGDATAPHLRFQQRYAKSLAKRFPKAAIAVENGATGGDSTMQGLARLEDKVLTRGPDLVLVGFGMNDHNVSGVPLERFKENLVTIVSKIREATGAEVILFSTFPPNPDWKHSSHRMEKYAAATQNAAKQLQCAYADVNAVWSRVLERKDLPSLLGNNINHPNDFGHWLYLQALEAVQF